MRILHIVGDSPFGGGSVVILELAKLGKRLGWDVDVLTTDPTFQSVLTQHNIGYVSLDVIPQKIHPIKDTVGLVRLTKYLAANHYDLVHTHTSKAGVLGRLAARIAKVRAIVHTVHGFAFHEGSSKKAIFLYSSIERSAARWCHRLVTVSHYHRDWALRLGIGTSNSVVAIPNGIDGSRVQTIRSRDTVRSDWGIRENEFILLTPGRLAEQKGIEYLLRALPALDDAILCNIRCVIAGTGPLEERLRQLTSDLGLNNYVRFVGFQRDIGSILNAADLVVLPSLWEGLSIAVLEAMAAGRPIITTNIGSNSELLTSEKDALLVPPKDPKALAKAITTLVSDRALAARLAESASEKFSRNYTVEVMTENYRRLYLDILGE